MGRGRHLSIALAIVLAIGCVPERDLELPPAPPGAESVVVVVDPGPAARIAGVAPLIFAARVGEPVAVAASAGGPGRVTALYYAATLEALALAPGRIAVATTGLWRPLPSGFLAARSADLADEALAWVTVDGRDEALSSVRITSAHASCARAGGCLIEGLCTNPCPTPTVPRVPQGPRAPDAPMVLPCLPGWVQGPTEVSHESCTHAALPECVGDRAAFAGDLACGPLGAACPPGEWPAGVPADRPRLYVRSGAVGGDGTEARPFGTLASALAAAALVPPPGAAILLAVGRHDGPAVITAPVTIFGACSGATVLGSADPEATLTVAASGVAVRGVRVEGAARALQVAPGGALALDGVVIGPGEDGVVIAEGGALSGRDVLARDLAGTALVSRGLVDLSRFAVERVGASAVSLAGVASRAQLTGFVARRIGRGASGGRGLDLRGHAYAELHGGLIEGLRGAAIQLRGTATATLTNLHVRDTSTTAEGLGGEGLVIDGSDAVVTLSRSVLERCQGTAIRASAGTVSMADGFIFGTRPGLGEDAVGSGLFARRPGASGERLDVSLVRTTLERNAGRGLYASGVALALRDVTVFGPPISAPGDLAEGLVADDSTLSIAALRILEARGTGMQVAGSAGAIVDLQIASSHARAESGIEGDFLVVQRGSVIDLDRYLGHRPDRAALTVSDAATTVQATDVTVNIPEICGVLVHRGASLSVDGLIVHSPFVSGIRVLGQESSGPGEESRFDGRNVVVELAQYGLEASRLRTTVDLRAFLFATATQAGISADLDAALSLHDGEIADTDVGVQLGRTDFDVATLLDGVRYRNVTEPFLLPAAGP